jgi:hypothetical protein
MLEGILADIRKIKTEPSLNQEPRSGSKAPKQPERPRKEQAAAKIAKSLIDEFDTNMAEMGDRLKAMGAAIAGRLLHPEETRPRHKFNDLPAHLVRSVTSEEKAMAAMVAALIDSKLPRSEAVVEIIGDCLVEYGDRDLARRIEEFASDGEYDRHAVLAQLWARPLSGQTGESAPVSASEERQLSQAELLKQERYLQNQLVPWEGGCAECRRPFVVGADPPVVVPTGRGGAVKFHAACHPKWRARMIEQGKRTGAL